MSGGYRNKTLGDNLAFSNTNVYELWFSSLMCINTHQWFSWWKESCVMPYEWWELFEIIYADVKAFLLQDVAEL